MKAFVARHLREIGLRAATIRALMRVEHCLVCATAAMASVELHHVETLLNASVAMVAFVAIVGQLFVSGADT